MPLQGSSRDTTRKSDSERRFEEPIPANEPVERFDLFPLAANLASKQRA